MTIYSPNQDQLTMLNIPLTHTESKWHWCDPPHAMHPIQNFLHLHKWTLLPFSPTKARHLLVCTAATRATVCQTVLQNTQVILDTPSLSCGCTIDSRQPMASTSASCSMSMAPAPLISQTSTAPTLAPCVVTHTMG